MSLIGEGQTMEGMRIRRVIWRRRDAEDIDGLWFSALNRVNKSKVEGTVKTSFFKLSLKKVRLQ